MSRKLSPELYSAQRKFFVQRSTAQRTALPDSVIAFARAARAAQKAVTPVAAPPGG